MDDNLWLDEQATLAGITSGSAGEEFADDQSVNLIPSWADRVGRKIVGLLFFIQAILLVASVVLVIVGVVLRYVFNHSLSWGEDMEILLFTWLVFLGIPRSLWLQEAPRLLLIRSKSVVVECFLSEFGLGVIVAYMSYVVFSFTRLFPSEAVNTVRSIDLPEYIFGLAIPSGAILSVGLCLLLLVRAGSESKVRYAYSTHLGFLIGLAAAGFMVISPLPSVWLAIAGGAALIALGVPIAVAIGVGGSALVVAAGGVSVSQVALQLVDGPNNIVLVALPFFLLTGSLIAGTSLARRLARFAQAVFGRLPGGLGVADVAASAIFANMSGSAIGDTAALGAVFIPQLVEAGEYRAIDAAALQSAAGVIGVIFPPAVAMILFATVTQTSVIKVFEATIVPGVMVAIGMATMTVVLQQRRRAQGQAPIRAFRPRFELLKSLPGALPVFAIPVVLDGGILTGIFTPAEAGAVAVLTTVVILFAMGEFRMTGVRVLLEKALDITLVPMFILVNVSVLDWGFAASGIANTLTHSLNTVGHSQLAFLLVVSLFLLLIHTVIETAPSILVFIPLIIPAAQAAHVDLLQLAAVVAINSTIGLMLPPVGTALFVSSQIAGVEARDVIKPVLPYVGMSLLIMLLVIFLPSLSLWLPSL